MTSPTATDQDLCTILIVDDEDDILDLLRYNLEKEEMRVIAAKDGAEALSAIGTESIDLVVLDIMMPNIDGMEVCRRIRSNSKFKTIPILFLTARSEEEDHIRGLDAGADSYLPKSFGIGVIVSQIKALLRGTKRIHADGLTVTVLDLVIDPERFRVFRNGQKERVELRFARKEFKLLYFLASTSGRVFKRKTLIRKIWGKNSKVGKRTVDVHVSRVNKKLGKYQGNDYIVSVSGVGYRFLEVE